MRRRDFIKVIATSAAAWPLVARAQQQPKVPVVAVFLFDTPQTDNVLPFIRKGLRDLGYVEGQNIVLEFRYAEGKPQRFPELAADLVRLNPNVIVVEGTDLAGPVKKATNTIPIVFISSGDAVQAGLVHSLARPTWNATGVTLIFDELASRRLQFLKESAPAIRRVGFLWNPEHIDHEYAESKRAAAALGVELVSLEVRGSDDVEPALRAAINAHIDSVYVVTARVTLLHQREILDFAANKKLPIAAGLGEWAEGGALLSYGPDLYQVALRAAAYVDKILKGAKPADLPIEQPTRFQLTINLRTAKTLKLVIPTSLLAIADKVIEA
jgi:putative tryptophan/tyrosine transport system substrate-binding protein